ncbi:oxygen-insensitive NAD(P)H nitroreductase [Ekhidna sp. MALMAid0563]|uniref:oxygen-insensitive NAD(P)H nitroreductase n=1 Tax=Ekhidna sp. MALMAid0563 TaxID=3143937 RepID=UPI0032DFB847
MNLIEILRNRYSTKEFDPEKKIADEDFEQIKALLRLSPSSTNAQPWHFLIANEQEGKERIAKSTEGMFGFNKAKILNASHVIVICSRVDIDENYLKHILEKEDEDGRFAESAIKERHHQGRKMFVDIHKYDLKDLSHWMEKQVYLNYGSLLLGAAALGIDALPMEGVDVKILDKEFGLRERGFTALSVVSLGYHKEEDFNAHLPKSRLPESEVLSMI